MAEHLWESFTGCGEKWETERSFVVFRTLPIAVVELSEKHTHWQMCFMVSRGPDVTYMSCQALVTSAFTETERFLSLASFFRLHFHISWPFTFVSPSHLFCCVCVNIFWMVFYFWLTFSHCITYSWHIMSKVTFMSFVDFWNWSPFFFCC